MPSSYQYVPSFPHDVAQLSARDRNDYMAYHSEHITLEGCAGLLSVATDNYAPRMATSWDMDAVGQDAWRMWRTEKVAK
jgi:hypothetical protein